MKRKSLVLVFGSMLLLAVGCSEKKIVCEGISFSRDDFKKRVLLKVPKLIPLQETYNNPRAFFLIGDSLILANNQPNNGPMLELFSLNTKRSLMQFGNKGVGPGEF
ncbi:MAG: BF3164 family lipoprotein, partial [Tannerellaceae bacterium]